MGEEVGNGYRSTMRSTRSTDQVGATKSITLTDSLQVLKSKTIEAMPDLTRTESRVGMVSENAHDLPWYAMGTITLVIAACCATVNFAMVMLGTNLLTLKFDTVQKIMEDTSSAAIGGLVLAGISVAYCLVAACLVLFIDPMCAGSGIPEMKGYLNGNYVPGLFCLKAFFVRILGIVFSTSAGLPIGREGPMVGIGGCVGYSCVHALALPFLRVRVRAAGDSFSPILVDEERFRFAKRIGCVLGAATGIATAFNAPLGGIMYLFEEVTVTNWAQELTFRAFVCTVLGSMMCKGLFNMMGDDVHRLLIYQDASSDHGQWSWIDVPPIVLLSLMLGLLAAVMTRAFIFVWSLRRRTSSRLSRYQPWAKLFEVLLYTFVVSFVFAVVPSIIDCSADSSATDSYGHHDDHRRLAGGLLQHRYTCPEGQHNRVATLLLDGAEGAVKHLFARGGKAHSIDHLALALGIYFLFALGMPGLSVPMGSFVPSMLIGALFGRLMGEVLSIYSTSFADPGVYSLAGSAAMLGGFTHMTIAIVALLVEAAYDLSLVPIMMLSIFVAYLVSKRINHHGYDEFLILAKGVPYLDAEMPHGIAASGASALDLCDTLPTAAHLSGFVSEEMLQAALLSTEHNYFPVFDLDEDGSIEVCVGLATRARLQVACKEAALARRASPEDDVGSLVTKKTSISSIRSVMSSASVKTYFSVDLDAGRSSLSLHGVIGQALSEVPVLKFADSAPHTINADMPVQRVYELFSRSGLQVACVASRSGRFKGILLRSSLIDASHIAIEAENRHHSRNQTNEEHLTGEESIVRSPSVAGLRSRSVHRDSDLRDSDFTMGRTPSNDSNSSARMRTEGASTNPPSSADRHEEVTGVPPEHSNCTSINL
eukprot:TRINITY_DN54399_c0_g1_i1.p1 TRINITY_DN54399_c0_g1~~TRINITY_DN54399_c0_g1_i1.p1  ORF type:complete len:878 (-),score=118.20 TRINITY_DN54399_c0_g1_i1:132-2765(-)